MDSHALLQGIFTTSDQTQVSHRTQVSHPGKADRCFTIWATREAPKCWSGQPIPSPGVLPYPGTGVSCIAGGFLLAELPWKPICIYRCVYIYICLSTYLYLSIDIYIYIYNYLPLVLFFLKNSEWYSGIKMLAFSVIFIKWRSLGNNAGSTYQMRCGMPSSRPLGFCSPCLEITFLSPSSLMVISPLLSQRFSSLALLLLAGFLPWRLCSSTELH